jgi:hypothetical protein
MTEKFAALTRLGRKGNVIAERARAGVSKGGFPRISLNNRGFMAIDGDMSKHVGEINPATGTQCLKCIILDVAPYNGTAKKYYINGYTEGSFAAPDCQSDDGVRPTGGENKQAASCAACIMNTWGSDGKGKACKDAKWLAIIMPEHFGRTLFRLDIPAASTGRFADYVEYVANLTLENAPADMAELVTVITWDAEKQGRLLFDAEATIDHLISIETVSELLQSGAVDKILRQGSATALSAPEEVKQIEAPRAAVKPVGAVQAKPAAVTAKAAPAPVQAATKPRSPEFKARVAGMNSARETVQEAAEAIKPAARSAAPLRKPGPLSKKPTAEDVPVSEKFGIAKPATPGAALSSALSMLDLGDDQ